MKTPDIPKDETDRLALLKSIGILDSEVEERFERITRVLCESLKVPISAISLIDKDRQWFKSIQGLDVRETPRDVSFCAHSIVNGEALTVEDATLDKRFSDNPLVIEGPGIRFYAGVPLKLNDVYIGALCAIDKKPRHISEAQKQIIQDLGHIVERELLSLDLEKQAELQEKYKTTQAFLLESNTILENSLNEIYMFDVQTLRFLHANKGARLNLGYSQEEMKQLTPVDIKPEYTEAQFYKLVAPLVENKVNKLTFRTTHQRKDGSLYSAEIHLQMGQYKRHLAFIAIILDVTRRESLIRELKTANEELEEFAYRTSHDLRSPLVSSIKLIDVAKGFVNKDNKDKAHKALDLASASLSNLELLVADILSLTQTKSEDEPDTKINISTEINNALEKITNMDGFDNLHIVCELNSREFIFSKHSRIKLIIENLLSNAVKYYNSENSEPFVKISTKEENGYFYLFVEDNGLGIPEKHQDEVFSMFKRFHTNTSFGSGLGLYMIQKSAKVLGGRIKYTDTGNGSLFTFQMQL